MNRTLIAGVTLVVGLLFGAEMALAGTIVNSKHDFSTTSTSGGNKLTAGTNETCVFCHTPHAASTNTVPLWNKVLSSAGYTAYSSTTLDGGQDLNAGVSLACLSCHDGTQAMDNLINAPGAGGYTATTGARPAGWTWTSPGATMNTTTGVLNAGIAYMGTNLGDDHPVGVQYAGSGYKQSTPSPGAGADPDFYAPTYSNASGTDRWWFDAVARGGDNDGVMDSNEIRMYTRTVAALANEPEPLVECASCHDPHNPDNGTFLRMSNASSAVCTACHSK